MPYFKLGTVHVPHLKNTALKAAVKMPPPETVRISMSQHIGAPAAPSVKPGDTVYVGTVVGTATGYVSSAVHSSVSGKVKKLDEILTSQGKKVPCVVIESDGLMTPDPAVKPPVIDTLDALVEAVRASGLVGLGGAGFPTAVKLDAAKKGIIKRLIINAAECEPYITSDTRTMIDKADEVKEGIELLRRFIPFEQIVIGIERNKPHAVAEMYRRFSTKSGIDVVILPDTYPQGGEKVLVYHTTKKVIPAGKLPIDVGCVVCNCTTIAAIGSYLQTGMPLVEKCITVDGGAVAEPQNLVVPIGTSLEDVFAFCGGLKSTPSKVLYGGPMMGVTVPDLSAPVLKNTNAVIALTEKESRLPKTSACIRCGACTNVCPLGLAPAQILLAYKKKDADMLKALSVESCMLCGCCSFNCPANRPLVQTNSLSKQLLKETKAKETTKHG